MSAFWDAWRKEIIRGATLFGAVLVLFFLVRYAVVRVRQCAAGDFKPSALRRNDVAVDFRVRLPAGARLDAMTVSGAVSVAHASAPLVAATVNGAIDAETSAGPVRAMSVNGSVRARMSAFGDTGAVSLLTVNGAATAELPRRPDADVEATTMNGPIETDYHLEVT